MQITIVQKPNSEVREGYQVNQGPSGIIQNDLRFTDLMSAGIIGYTHAAILYDFDSPSAMNMLEKPQIAIKLLVSSAGILSGNMIEVPDEQEIKLPVTDLASRFQAYAKTWRRQTQYLSSVAKMVSHPAYIAIIEMGRDVIPLLLEELRDRPDHWFIALNQITNEDPSPPGSTFSEAVKAWLTWGKEKGYLC